MGSSFSWIFRPSCVVTRFVFIVGWILSNRLVNSRDLSRPKINSLERRGV